MHKCDVRERLREVAQHTSVLGIVLLGEHDFATGAYLRVLLASNGIVCRVNAKAGRVRLQRQIEFRVEAAA